MRNMIKSLKGNCDKDETLEKHKKTHHKTMHSTVPLQNNPQHPDDQGSMDKNPGL